MSIKRKIKRQADKEAQKEFEAKVGLFNQIGDACLVCAKPFDKKDKEMVMSWYVVVRQEEEVVNLYCPECWGRSLSLIENIKEDLSERAKKQNQV
jgi:hypothetical protein